MAKRSKKIKNTLKRKKKQEENIEEKKNLILQADVFDFETLLEWQKEKIKD